MLFTSIFFLDVRLNQIKNLINPFYATGLFLYPRKTSENLWFSDVFKGYKKRPVAWNVLSI